jgi:hypothetical protein
MRNQFSAKTPENPPHCHVPLRLFNKLGSAPGTYIASQAGADIARKAGPKIAMVAATTAAKEAATTAP